MDHRRLIATAAVVASAAATWFILTCGPSLPRDGSLGQLLAEGSETAARFAEFEAAFGTDDTLVVLVEDASERAVFNRDHAALLRAIVAELEDDPGIDSVVSIANLPDVDLRSGLPRFRDSMLPDDPDALTDDEVTALRDDPLLRRGLLTKNGHGSATWVLLDAALKHRPDYADEVERIVDAIEALPRPAPLNLSVAGFPLIHAVTLEMMWRDAFVLVALAAAVVALVVLLGGVRLRFVIAFVLAWPLLGAGLVAWFRLTGRPLHLLSNALVPIVLIVSSSVLVHYGRALQFLGARARGTREVLGSCALGTLTTAASFATLITAPVRPLSALGVEVTIATITAFALVTAALRIAAIGTVPVAPATVPVRGPDSRRTKIALVIAAVVLGAPWFLLDRNPFPDDARFLSHLPAGHVRVAAAERVRAALGAESAFEVIVAFDDAEAMRAQLADPDFYLKLSEFDQQLRAVAGPRVPFILSPVTLVSSINNRLARLRGETDFRVTKAASRLAAGLMSGRFPMPTALRAWVEQLASGRHLRFGCRIPELSPAGMWTLRAELRDWVFGPAAPGLGAERIYATGYSVLVAETASAVRASQVQSGITTLAALALLLLIVARSLRVWLVVLGTTAATVIGVLDVVWMSGGRLSIYTTVLTAAILAVVIDDTIHVLRACRGQRDPDRDVVRRQIVGPSIRISSVALIAGFGCFLLSALPGYRQFGWTAAGGVAIALFWDLLILPPLLLRRRSG